MKKRLLKIALSAMFLLSAVFALVSCDNGAVTSIAIGTEPQTVYVEGNDLDLSAGTLNVTTKKGTTQVALSEAQVTGYDKNATGKQTLTVTYGDVTTTLEVSVNPRVQADTNCVKDYLIGEELNREQGKIKITRDDGTSISVSLSDSSLQILGYDFSEAGTAAVKVYYSDGGVDYIGSYSVNVYDVDKATVTKPSKINYQSHETVLSTDGGYLTLTAHNDQLTKYVALEDCTITGFDPSAATAENRTTPLVQTITASYGDLAASFDIKITYSDISVIKDAATALAALDFSGEELPAVTEAQAEKAKEAVELYNGLTDDEKALITDAEVSKVVLSAVVYYQAAWATSKTAYQDAITFKSGVVYPVTGASYNTIETAVAALNKEEDLYTLCDLLVSLRTNYAEMVVSGEETVSTYLAAVASAEDVKTAVELLEETMSIYNNLNGVPAAWSYTWEYKDWNKYKSAVEPATTSILSLSEKAGSLTGYYCILLTSWKEDAFDIIYTYQYTFYELNEDNGDSSLADLAEIYFPAKLQELYEDLYYAYSAGYSIYQESYYLYQYYSYYGQNFFDYFYSAGILTTDTTTLFYFYDIAEKLATEIVTGDNAMLKYVYTSVPFTFGSYSMSLSSVVSYVRQYDLNYSSKIYDDEDCAALMDRYFDVLDSYGTVTSAELIAKIKTMTEKFADLAPAKQYAFLASLNPYYTLTSYGGPTAAFDTSCYTYFTYYIYSAYLTDLKDSSDACNALVGLLYSMEYYAKASYSQTYLGYFLSAMSTTQKYYAALDPETKIVFDDSIGSIYQKYVAIYNLYDKSGNLVTTPEISEEWQAVLDELDAAIENSYYAYLQYYNNSSTSMSYSAFLLCYEWVKSLEAKLADAPESVLSVYRTVYLPLTIYTSSTNSSTITYTREYFVTGALKNYYMAITMGNTLGNYMLLDMYEAFVTDNLAAFMAKAAAFICADDITAYTAADVIALEKEYRALNDSELYFFTYLDSYAYYYWSALDAYYVATLGVETSTSTSTSTSTDTTEATEEGDTDTTVTTSYGAVYDAASALLVVEINYVYYVLSSDSNKADRLTTLNTAWAAFEEAYAELSEEEKAKFDALLSEKKAYYSSAVTAVNTPATDTESEAA